MFEMIWMIVGAALALTIRRLFWICRWKLNKAKLDRKIEAERAEMQAFVDDFFGRVEEE